MNKILKIAAVVVAVLAVLGLGYYLMNKDDASNSSSSNGNETSQASEEGTEATEASFASLASSGKAQQCTYTYDGPEGTGSGKVYADGKGRGRMNINLTSNEGKTSETNTLITADKAYAWFTVDGKTSGFMFDKNEYDSTAGSSTSGADTNKKFNMDCKGWNVDESLLTPPSNVNFTSFSMPS